MIQLAGALDDSNCAGLRSVTAWFAFAARFAFTAWFTFTARLAFATRFAFAAWFALAPGLTGCRFSLNFLVVGHDISPAFLLWLLSRRHGTTNGVRPTPDAHYPRGC